MFEAIRIFFIILEVIAVFGLGAVLLQLLTYPSQISKENDHEKVLKSLSSQVKVLVVVLVVSKAIDYVILTYIL